MREYAEATAGAAARVEELGVFIVRIDGVSVRAAGRGVSQVDWHARRNARHGRIGGRRGWQDLRARGRAGSVGWSAPRSSETLGGVTRERRQLKEVARRDQFF